MAFTLPDHLPFPDRTVPLSGAEPRGDGEFVLYWAHHALRAHENPALETAAAMAVALDRPLLVYQGLGGRHRYNSDRHHRFILEAARDFAAELAGHGLGLHFHLPEDPVGPGPLGGLVARSALTVSELFPAPPFPDWTRRHAERNPAVPFWLVDAQCVYPMPASAKAPERAFRFREQARAEWDRRVPEPWPEHGPWPRPFRGEVGFEPFDLASDLDEAIAACAVDHAVPAVADTAGGSRAGYARWGRFRDTALDAYHRLRNDAALADGVSRMSPYLHYGCVSPFRIAREAHASGGRGAHKFLDELLVWRELAHHHCHHADALETLEALPRWASETLAAHADDPRPAVHDWETLARGRTGTPLWDLAQRSLLRRGELHNNVRMTWGKAFLPWARTPQRALKLMIDLNHRYALDGSDPNSYGGLLWCLGAFDRPFPASAVFGAVRGRSIERHAARLDLGRYAERVSRPAGGRRLRVLVIGAGMAGLAAARTLEDQGHEVTVVDKGRGPGGRMSTRRDGDLRFDHGAQYFTARDPRFLRHVVAWRERGLVAPWKGRIGVVERGAVRAAGEDTVRWVGVPGMNAVCRDMADGLPDVRFAWRVASLRHADGCWRAESAEGERIDAENVVLTLPPPQAAQLVEDEDVRTALEGAIMRPCWAVMAHFDAPLHADWDGLFVNEGPLAWLAAQRARPGRPAADAWVLHANPEWSEAHLEDEPGAVADALIEAARALPGCAKPGLIDATAHRWRFALAGEPLDAGALWIPATGLALAGDWAHGSRVEGAFLSGVAAAGRLMAGALPAAARAARAA